MAQRCILAPMPTAGCISPGFSPEAATFLVEERSIKGVGTDTLSIDNGPSATFDVHYTVLGAGLLGTGELEQPRRD